MANIDNMDIQHGIQRGFKRASDEIDNAAGIDPELQEKLATALSEWPEELNPRFVRLFSEMATIASISRNTFDFPRLETVDIRAQLGMLALFFDSFRHK